MEIVLNDTEQGQGADPVEAIPCTVCDEGLMKVGVIRPYNASIAVVLLAVGVLCLAIGVLAPMGLVLILLGIYFVLARKKVWRCERCGAIVERA